MKNVTEYLGPSEEDEAFAANRAVQRVEVFNTSAAVSLGLSDDGEYIEIKGLVANISSQGCCVVFCSEIVPDSHSFVRVTIGKQFNIPAQIRWVHQVERGIFKMGLCYQL